jgi:S-DNA-T family DNA segregation ATPase FtsK/SpoIIIE
MAKKSLKKKKKNKKLVLYSETKKGILAVIAFTLAVLSFLSFFNGAGTFGRYFLKLSRLLFGQGFFLISVSFTLIGLAILLPRFSLVKQKKPVYRTIFIGIVLFIFSILGIFYVFGLSGCDTAAGCTASNSASGGYLGLIIGYPLINFLGFWASLVVLLALLIISILITFNISLIPIKKREEKEVSILTEEKKPLALAGKKSSLWRKLKEKAKEEINRGKEEKKESISQDHLLGRKSSSDEKVKAAEGAIVGQRLAKGRSVAATSLDKPRTGFKMPALDYLEKDKGQPTSGDIKANINTIKRTLENFGIEVEMAEVNVGPTVTQYTLRPAQGIKLAKITALQNDLALALAAHPLRIEAPIPGRSLVGIEIPNRTVVMVRLRSLLERPTFQESTSYLTFALGRDVAGNPLFADLTRMPHLLVAGATGTGKTIALNNLIVSLLYRNSPEDLKFIMIDPKRVELTAYDSIPHLLAPVIVQADKAIGALRWAVSEMERRFGVFQEAGKRDIRSYNQSISTSRHSKAKPKNPVVNSVTGSFVDPQDNNTRERLSYIVVVIDELADLMASHGREVEAAIVRLAQMARAVGIHLVVSTQRPSVEVITGLIKANITSRMAFQVASQVDSRTVLDMAGAEKLLGNGDMLFLAGNSAKPRRVQGAYVSDKEVKKVADYLKSVGQPEYQEEVVSTSSVRAGVGTGFSFEGGGDEDELLGEAKEVVIQAGKASASLLQRRLRVGYARAARLLDILEEQGIVGPADGAKPRDVFIDEGAEGE